MSTGATTGRRTRQAGQRPAEAAPVQEEPTGGQTRALPQLPTELHTGGESLRSKTVLIYGPRGIGKSSLAAKWGRRVLFFDTAGELDGITGYKHQVSSWEEFRLACAALDKALEDAAKEKSPLPYDVVAIDTADLLGTMCSAYTNEKLGIAHASDAEWGKGWDAVRSEFMLRLSKLAAMRGIGLLLISHSKDVEIKTRNAKYDKHVPTLTGGVRDACVGMADLVLFVDFSDDDESEERVIFTKPTRYHEAKERGENPRLPAQIRWPLGESGFELIEKEWDANN